MCWGLKKVERCGAGWGAENVNEPVKGDALIFKRLVNKFICFPELFIPHIFWYRGACVNFLFFNKF